MTMFTGGSIKEREAKEEEFRRNTLFINLMEGKIKVDNDKISDDDARRVIARLDAVPGDNKRVRDRMESQIKKSGSLPTRTADTMSEAIAMPSPSGTQSKRSKDAAAKRLSKTLFGEKGLQRPMVTQPSDELVMRRKAAELRGLADRGMSPRKHRKAAADLEAKADRLINGVSKNKTLSQRTLDKG